MARGQESGDSCVKKGRASLFLHCRQSFGKTLDQENGQKQFFKTCYYDLQMLKKCLLARTQSDAILGQSMCLSYCLSFIHQR